MPFLRGSDARWGKGKSTYKGFNPLLEEESQKSQELLPGTPWMFPGWIFWEHPESLLDKSQEINVTEPFSHNT